MTLQLGTVVYVSVIRFYNTGLFNVSANLKSYMIMISFRKSVINRLW